ncbi:HNH endonuclease [Aquihabitans sp. G128]|uniref:HNH endonuclease n=1 Tax=Aquihabitans sp. G128 TaxID=2849779 RepID=UPI001C2363DD|nr:HNH endonuclease [Aquihabitans sp. G128]QXC59342.1 HNH endonuclease [Aquihabitans sp. G128]
MTAWADRDQRRAGTLSGSARKARTARIIRRDHGICHVCGKPGATEADHVVPLAEGGSDTDANLAAIHAKPCHEAKTRAEQARGRARRGTASRPREQHPGLRMKPA